MTRISRTMTSQGCLGYGCHKHTREIRYPSIGLCGKPSQRAKILALLKVLISEMRSKVNTFIFRTPNWLTLSYEQCMSRYLTCAILACDV